MEIKDLISLMWRNLRYLVLGLALGAILGLVAAQVQTPVYEATTKILISRTRQQSNADMLPLSDEQLVAINLQLAKSQPVLDEITQQVGVKVDADSIQVSSIPNTLIVQVKVQDTDPIRAAQIANTLVQILIQRNEDLLSGRYAAFEQSIDTQIGQVQAQIDDLQTQVSQISDTSVQDQLTRVSQQIGQLSLEIATLKQEISAFPVAPTPIERVALTEKQAQLEQLNSLMSLYRQIETNLTYTGRVGQGDTREDPQLATLQATLDLYQQMYLSLLSNRETVHLARMQSSENVVQIVAAIPPKKAAMPIPILYMLVGVMAGLGIAATVILILDHFDTSLRTPAQAEKELQVPVLGLVSDDGLPHSPVTLSRPFSADADAFRALGASVEIVSLEGHIQALLVLNGGAKDGKTCIAANLAVVNAQQGRRVTLVDGDLRRPRLHDLFGVENQKGLSDVVHGRAELRQVYRMVEGLRDLRLVTGGQPDEDPTRWLDAVKWGQVLDELQAQSDLVIVDSPPAESADAQVLASRLGAILLVVRCGRTRVEAAQATLRRFQLLGAAVVGMVLSQPAQHRNVIRQFLSWKRKTAEKKENAYEIRKETDDISVSPT